MDAENEVSPATKALLDQAGDLCLRRGVRLTPLRRQVLGMILGSPVPVGAYHLLDQLRATRAGAAPPTVYRALDFLMEQHLIHRIERLAAFVGCNHPDADGHAHAHTAQFLICKRCGRVAELEDGELEQALGRAAQRTGFAVSGATVEAEGTCATCAHAA